MKTASLTPDPAPAGSGAVSSRRWWWIGLSAAALALVALSGGWYLQSLAPPPAPGAPEARYDIPRTISYSFTLKNDTNRVLNNVEFWTYAPVRQTATQRCCRHLTVSQPYQLDSDRWGNQVMHFTVTELPPYASRVIRIQADMELAERSNLLPDDQPDRFLAGERFVEVDHPDIQATAQRLASATPAATVRRIHDWVAGNLRYAGYRREERGALYALQKRQGDCTEFMDLFIALARANGIPARAVGGYVYDQNAIASPSDYHNWAEFYLDGVWHIADPQKRRFVDRQSYYIAMRLLSGSAEPMLGKAHRFWHSGGEGLSVRMN